MSAHIGPPPPALRARRRPRCLVVGLGNVLLQDDGVGVHAVRALGRNLPGHAIAAEVGTAALDALHLFEWADRVIAIDAMEAGGPPGTVYACDAGDVDDRGISASLHELGLLAVLRFLPTDARPHLSVIGVEPAHIAYSMDLSPPVAAALPLVHCAVRSTLALWAGGGQRG